MIAALVPAKPLDQAKRRLAALLSEDERPALALAMLDDVLRALQAVPRVERLAVVSPDADVLARARALGAEAIAEPRQSRGINQALDHALSILGLSDDDTLLIVLADVPAVLPAELEAVLDARPPSGPGAVLCPSLDRGTSALAVRPPHAIPFRFGRHSFLHHRREAAARRLPARVLRVNSLAADIDGPNDLLDLMSELSAAHHVPPRAPATARLLQQLRLAERVAAAARPGRE